MNEINDIEEIEPTGKYKIGDLIIFRNPLYTRLSGKTAKIINVHENNEYGILFSNNENNNKAILAFEHELVLPN